MHWDVGTRDISDVVVVVVVVIVSATKFNFIQQLNIIHKEGGFEQNSYRWCYHSFH